jgi:hypothetical protein
MKKVSILLSAILCAGLMAGCMTHKVSTVSGSAATGFTTTTTQVDEANLAIDASVLQGLVATATALAVQHNPDAVPALKTAQRALDDVANGISQQSVQDVLGKLKAQSNQVVAQQVDSLLKAASGVEQKLVQKYGATVGGEIAIAMIKAADAGMIVGLAGK